MKEKPRRAIMIKHYECKSTIQGIDDVLVFDLDIEKGILSGPGKRYFESQIKVGYVGISPTPSAHWLSKEPYKSKTDMAAMIAPHYEIPEDFAEYYPRVKWKYDPNVKY